MKLFVKVKTRAKQSYLRKIDDHNFEIGVQAAPVKGQANQAIVEALARYFGVPRLKVRILAGFKAKKKIIEIKS